ncbi:hypothetical protein CROQUDRAFT_82786 [Cronartium quercuum f. sp. fusiforme G11]|uniref:Vacuolar protein sorting-associated protein 54 C-terminal domain-containing protein n=1 Tax=Cronartium quercuum f. sp. fusiforme G11 TaxID=708437 RepID=A0A9P6N952_9BASI|nr:hypothetical protein CROQUDRAFT_82786 [Cronartium quercuum f. sp. fusiforme G11]
MTSNHNQLQLLGTKSPIGRYAISTVLNSASTSASITSSIPSSLKPSALAALVSPTTHSSLSPAHKRSNPNPITLSISPKFSDLDFQHYLKQIEHDWENWETNSNLDSHGPIQFQNQKGFHQNINSNHLPSLDKVPDIFFKDEFSLSNPITFDILTDNNNQNKSIKDLFTDQLNQDKLSYYLDIIEINLLNEINLQSYNFFNTLNNLKNLNLKIHDSINQIHYLNNELNHLNQNLIHNFLNIKQLNSKVLNLTKIHQSLFHLFHFYENFKQIDSLLDSGQFFNAINLISDLEQQLNQSNQKPIKLNQLKSLKEIPQKLNQYKSIINKSIETDLISLLLFELRFDISQQSKSEYINFNEKDARNTKKEEIKQRLKERIRINLNNLINFNHINNSRIRWRESVLKEIREIIINNLGISDNQLEFEQVSNDSIIDQRRAVVSEKTSNLSRTIKSINHEHFLKLAKSTFDDLLTCLESIQIQSDVLINIAKESQALEKETANSTENSESIKVEGFTNELEINQDSIKSSNVDIDALEIELIDVIQAAAELSNTKFSKIIGLRTDLHSNLNLKEFLEIFKSSWNFVIGCEIISHRMIIGLRGILVSQSKSFLQVFHQNKITESAKLVEQEQWSQVDVPSSVQKTVKLIIHSAVEDPTEFLIISTDDSINESLKSTSDLELTESDSNKVINIEGTCLHAVGAVIETLKTLSNYLKVIINCSLLITDGMGKIVEFLKAFNSRTCQVVLGAGAMRSAGLKNITAKHLALASQALSIMVQLIPYIRECFRRHLSPKQAVMLVDFDKLKRDYQEHQNEIHAKLISIMSDRLSVHLQSFKVIDWESEDESLMINPTSVNPYLESLFKEVSTLHKVLNRYLSTSTLELIMTQVFTSINSTLSYEYGNLELKSDLAHDRLLRDAIFIVNKEVELNAPIEVQKSAKSMEEIVRSKRSPSTLTTETPSTTIRSTFRFLSPRSPNKPTELVLPQEPVKESEDGDQVPEPPEKDLIPEPPVDPPSTPPPSNPEILEPLTPKPTEPSSLIPTASISTPSDSNESESSPNKILKPKLTLSQRLAALASNRRSSLPNSIPTTTTPLTSPLTIGVPINQSINDHNKVVIEDRRSLEEVKEIKSPTFVHNHDNHNHNNNNNRKLSLKERLEATLSLSKVNQNRKTNDDDKGKDKMIIKQKVEENDDEIILLKEEEEMMNDESVITEEKNEDQMNDEILVVTEGEKETEEKMNEELVIKDEEENEEKINAKVVIIKEAKENEEKMNDDIIIKDEESKGNLNDKLLIKDGDENEEKMYDEVVTSEKKEQDDKINDETVVAVVVKEKEKENKDEINDKIIKKDEESEEKINETRLEKEFNVTEEEEEGEFL